MEKKKSAFSQCWIWNFENLNDCQLINSFLFWFQIVGDIVCLRAKKSKHEIKYWGILKRSSLKLAMWSWKGHGKIYFAKLAFTESLHHFYSIENLYRLQLNVTILKSLILKIKFVNQMSNTDEINLLSQNCTYRQEWRRKNIFHNIIFNI